MNNTLQSIEWLMVGITFIGGIYMYVNHTRKLHEQQEKLNAQDARLNDQQKQINDYQLQKNKEEALEKKQANIEARLIENKVEKYSTWTLVISNTGKAKATNVQFESETVNNDDKSKIFIDPNFYPFPSILPENRIGIGVELLMGHEKVHRIKFSWDDESGTGRSQEQDVIFN